MRPLVKLAATAGSTAEIPELVDAAWRTALAPHSGPAFVDLPLDHVFGEAAEPAPEPPPSPRAELADGAAVERAAALLREAVRPVVMAGTDLYWGHGEVALRALAEALGIPGLPQRPRARVPCPPTTSWCSPAPRRTALEGADVALVVGAPLDFRLGFGRAFGPETEIVVVDVAEPEREHPRRRPSSSTAV